MQWLDVIRYDAESLHDQFGVRFRLVESSKNCIAHHLALPAVSVLLLQVE